MTLDDKLLHYGVKGMKWGVTKQKKSKSTTDAESRLKDAKANKKESGSISKILTKDFSKNKRLSKLDVQYAKEDLSSSKILDKLNSKPKSDTQIKTEAKYKSKGMTDDEAAVAAYKNIRTKKILAAVAVTAVAVGTVSAGRKLSDEYLDTVIKKGSSLQNISDDGNVGIRDAFYSSKAALDKIKYKGLYGTQLKETNRSAFVKNVEVISDIRKASTNNARKTLKEMVDSDPSFKNALIDNMRGGITDPNYDKYTKARESLSKGKVDSNVYDRFNALLVNHSPGMQRLTDKYYDSLSKKGYNAIKDINDAKYSGYKALDPIITFNSKGKVEVKDVKKLAQNEINKHRAVSMGALLAGPTVAQGAVITSATLAGKQAPKIALRRRVDAYRQENPGTKLTNTEISRMLERNDLNV